MSKTLDLHMDKFLVQCTPLNDGFDFGQDLNSTLSYDQPKFWEL